MSHPQPLTAEELARGDDTRLAALSDALGKFDQEQMFTDARSHLVAGVWDQTSDINGIDAATVLASAAPPAGGAIVTVRRDGVVQVLQPFDPQGGPGAAIDPAQAQDIGERMADAMAADDARQLVLQQIPAELLAFLDPTPQPGTGGGDGGSDGGGGDTPGGDPIVALQELVTTQATRLDAQQETIDWLAGIVLDLSTGTEADQ